ncbi:MAG: chemotaxis-specific protein-glutamate methyltransferase CheB [Selenomonadaceae bacterium]
MIGIRVLVVDDSMVFREALVKGLSQYLPKDSLVERAKDSFEARDKILEFEPDVMILDVEMPRMDGIEFLRRLIIQYPQPTVVLSGSERYRESAMNAGAKDFMIKPDGMLLRTGQFFAELAQRAYNAAKSQQSTQAAMNRTTKRLIAIGASTGGTEAIAKILGGLTLPLPGIVIVQHIPPLFSTLFAERLNTTCCMKVKEAKGGEQVLPGCVFIAPGDKHMVVKKVAGNLQINCITGERVNGHCPSVDVLFDSVAEAVGDGAVGVILTGMGNDGAKGLLKMRQSGAKTLGQNEASSVVYGMPRAAYEIGAVERQLPLTSMAIGITSLVR